MAHPINIWPGFPSSSAPVVVVANIPISWWCVLSPFYLWTGCNLVSVAVNKEPPMTARAVDGGPLYLVAPWDSSKYRKSAPTVFTSTLLGLLPGSQFGMLENNKVPVNLPVFYIFVSNFEATS